MVRSDEHVLYPMLGVGAFFAAFWAGIVIGYDLGFSCLGLLLHGVGFALLAAMLIAKLERHDMASRARRASESMDARSRRRPALPVGPSPDSGGVRSWTRPAGRGGARTPPERALARPV